MANLQVVNYEQISIGILNHSQEHLATAEEHTRQFNESLPSNPIERQAYLGTLDRRSQITRRNLDNLDAFLSNLEDDIIPRTRQEMNRARQSLNTLRPRMEAEQIANNRWVYCRKNSRYIFGALILGLGIVGSYPVLAAAGVATTTSTLAVGGAGVVTYGLYKYMTAQGAREEEGQ